MIGLVIEINPEGPELKSHITILVGVDVDTQSLDTVTGNHLYGFIEHRLGSHTSPPLLVSHFVNPAEQIVGSLSPLQRLDHQPVTVVVRGYSRVEQLR